NRFVHSYPPHCLGGTDRRLCQLSQLSWRCLWSYFGACSKSPPTISSTLKVAVMVLGSTPSRIFFVLPYLPKLTTLALTMPIMSSSFSKPLTRRCVNGSILTTEQSSRYTS